MKEVFLPSGSKLEIGEVPFGQAKRLYQAVMTEFKGVRIDMSDVLNPDFIKNLVCASIDSRLIEEALAPCLARCTYGGLKITADTFEPIAARSDYMDLCAEVLKETILPFTKSLFVQFQGISSALASLQGPSAERQTLSTTSSSPPQDTAPSQR